MPFTLSPEIAMCINSALVQFGFRGGNVLEPSMGIGNFFGSMPAPMQRSNLYGVSLTAFQEELQSSFIRMPISVSQDLRIPHIRITL